MAKSNGNGNGNTVKAELIDHSVLKNDQIPAKGNGLSSIYYFGFSQDPYGDLGALMPAPGQLPQYWSRGRDALLRASVMIEGQWANAVGMFLTKLASLSWELQGKRVQRYQEMFLEDWTNLIYKVGRDFVTTDNGFFVQVVKASNASGSRVLGMVHLDSRRTYRTRDPNFPALYVDMLGNVHKLRADELMSFADMVSPDERFPGIGTCLYGTSVIKMGDGSKKMIKDLVKNKSSEEVITLLPDGTLSTRPIVGWHINPMGNRTWVNIRGKLSNLKTAKKIKKGVPRNDLWVTNDHPVLTPNGWVRAEQLKTGSCVVTDYPEPNAKQLSFIVASVLGDMSINKSKLGKSPQLTMGHSVRQREWFELKRDVLKDFHWTEIKTRGNGASRRFEKVESVTKVTPGLVYLYNLLYPSGKKNIPAYVAEEFLSPMFLATWYLDDGWIQLRESTSKNGYAVIGNSGAEIGNTEEFVEMFNRHGYECNAVSAHGHNNPHKDIHFTSRGSKKLFSEVAPYVIPEMRYKLPTQYDLAEYDSSLWDLGSAGRFVDEVEISTRIPQKSGKQADVYCLDVEDTHNFVANSFVVHNCAASRSWNSIVELAALEQLVSEKVTGSEPTGISFVNAAVNEEQLQGAVDIAKSERTKKGYVRYMGMVVVPLTNLDVSPAVATIELKGLPDGFDSTKERENCQLTYANSLGISPQSINPRLIGSGSRGTSAQSRILEEQEQGKLPSLFRKEFSHLLNSYILPDTVTFYFSSKDFQDEKAQADISYVRAQTRQLQIMSGEISADEAKQLAVTQNDLPRSFDPTTPDDTLSDDEKPYVEATETTTGDTESSGFAASKAMQIASGQDIMQLKRTTLDEYRKEQS